MRPGPLGPLAPAAPLLTAAVLAGLLGGCLTATQPLAPADAALPAEAGAMTLPPLDFYDVPYVEGVGFHTLEALEARMEALAAQHDGLARLEVVGESREGRPIRALVLTDPVAPAAALPGARGAPLFDGGHHPNEVEGVESVLFLAEFLLANHAANATVRGWLRDFEVWLVPLVNPDGYVAQTRHNAAFVNLNRNYDVAWCHPAALNTCPPEPVPSTLFPLTGPTAEYAGEAPFSEPESRAVRDLVLRLGDRLPFYLTHHTDLHCIFGPWVAPDAGAPFEVPPGEQAVLEAVYAWVREHTEFGGGDAAWGTGACVAYNHGGGSMDWVYAQARVPSFTMETAGSEAREGLGNFNTFGTGLAHDELPRWLRATLPVQLLFLANAERLQAWDAQLVDPLLPAGVPGGGP